MTFKITRTLPLLGSWHSGKFTTCATKCNDECMHDPSNAGTTARTFGDIAQASIDRRRLLKGGVVVGLVATFGTVDSLATTRVATASDGSGLAFTPVPPNTTDTVTVPQGYAWRTFIRWGDPILPGVGGLNADFSNITPEQQAGAFGYNNDFVAFLPATRGGASSDEGLMWVNHEYTNPELMFAGYGEAPEGEEYVPTREQVLVELNAHGGSVVEVYRGRDGGMSYRRGAPLNRRITAFTEMEITGPAAGAAKLQTAADPSGTRVLGTLNNCAGGKTPWGTIVTAEENFNQYFGNGEQGEEDPTRLEHERYGVSFGGASFRQWERYEDRFDLSANPNEPYRFGWIVEVDPYDPRSTPKKRTALGRFKHEGAEMVVTPEGNIAVYLGDDERFDYLYKYVSDGTYLEDMSVEEAGALLDEGTLYVAVFNDNQTGEWIPLVWGQNGLTPENGFADQADVLIKARFAGDTVGATPMDRPEDVTPDTNRSGYVYVCLTNNTRRANPGDEGYDPGDEPNAANPRVNNAWGHVIEMIETDATGTATTFSWDFLLLCGDPEDESTFFGGFPKDQVSPISAPDNSTITPTGDLLLATDGQPGGLGINDSFHIVPMSGPERGHVQQFCSVPVGAEACGPEFTPDGQTLFLAVQHPGDGGTVAEPISQFPDEGRPARPAMVSIWKAGGGVIGS